MTRLIFIFQSVGFLKGSAFIVQIWGKQKDEKPKGPIKKKSGLVAGLHTVNTNQSVSSISNSNPYSAKKANDKALSTNFQKNIGSICIVLKM